MYREHVAKRQAKEAALAAEKNQNNNENNNANNMLLQIAARSMDIDMMSASDLEVYEGPNNSRASTSDGVRSITEDGPSTSDDASSTSEQFLIADTDESQGLSSSASERSVMSRFELEPYVGPNNSRASTSDGVPSIPEDRPSTTSDDASSTSEQFLIADTDESQGLSSSASERSVMSRFELEPYVGPNNSRASTSDGIPSIPEDRPSTSDVAPSTSVPMSVGVTGDGDKNQSTVSNTSVNDEIALPRASSPSVNEAIPIPHAGDAPAIENREVGEPADPEFVPIIWPENDCITDYVDYDLGSGHSTDREWQKTEKVDPREHIRQAALARRMENLQKEEKPGECSSSPKEGGEDKKEEPKPTKRRQLVRAKAVDLEDSGSEDSKK